MATTSSTTSRKTQAYRAPGATQAAFACEQVIDELAEKLKIDPIEFRLKNAAKEGTRRVDGPVYPRVGFIETLEAAKNSDHWKTQARPARTAAAASPAGFWFNIGGDVKLLGQRQRRRHRDPGRRLDRHRRHADEHRHATWPRRSASPPKTSSPQVGDTDSRRLHRSSPAAAA